MSLALHLVGVVGTVIVVLTVHGSTNRDVPTHRDDSNLKISSFKWNISIFEYSFLDISQISLSLFLGLFSVKSSLFLDTHLQLDKNSLM